MPDQTHSLRRQLEDRRKEHLRRLDDELHRLTNEAAQLGVERIILFGSMVHGNAGLSSDADLLIVWDTSLDFISRTAELYRRLKPRVAVDMLVYTPEEFAQMKEKPFVRRAIGEGKVLYEA